MHTIHLGDIAALERLHLYFAGRDRLLGLARIISTTWFSYSYIGLLVSSMYISTIYAHILRLAGTGRSDFEDGYTLQPL